MKHSRIPNNRINKLHEKALRLVHIQFSSTFSEFLIKNNSVKINQKNFQTLAHEMLKVKNKLAPHCPSLRNNTTLPCRSTNTILDG